MVTSSHFVQLTTKYGFLARFLQTNRSRAVPDADSKLVHNYHGPKEIFGANLMR